VSWVENVAERVLSELGITSATEINVDNIAWTRNALVCYEHLDGAAARLVVRGDSSVITVSTRLASRGQKRFAAAHELGHLELHRKLNNLNLCLADDVRLNPNRSFEEPSLGKIGKEPEQEASQFAGALLMPAFLFGPLLQRDKPTMRAITKLAETFDTSLTATAIRYARMQKEPCAVVWSDTKRITWYQPSRDFSYHVRVGEELDKYSIAIDFFEGRELPGRPTAVDASCWLAPGRFTEDAMIQEDSLSLPSYNSVLTLLWIDKDIDREYDPSKRMDRRW
jgi:Zn-dependent peptidase ImmA (M78 family)